MKNKAIKKLEIATDKISTAIRILRAGNYTNTQKLDFILNDLYKEIEKLNN